MPVDDCNTQATDENMITFHNYTSNNLSICSGDAKEVMRITADGITVNPDLSLDEAAQQVIKALEIHIGRMVSAEREACARVCDEAIDTQEEIVWNAAIRYVARRIRARGEKCL